MMTCQQVAREMGALLDGELRGALRHEVETHVAACPSCRCQREEMEGLQRSVEALPCPPLPEDFNMRVMEALERRQARPAWRDRLDRGLDLLTRLLLGAPASAPTTAGAFARGALASGAAVAGFATASAFLFANTILYGFYGNVSMMARTVHDVVQRYPMVPDLATSPWSMVCILGALQAILFVGGLRVLDLRGFWRDLRNREPMGMATMGPVLVGGFLLTVLGCATLQAVGACAVLTGQGSPWHLAGSTLPWAIRGLAIAQVVVSLGLVVKRGHLGLGALSLCFYVTLLLGYLAEKSFMLAWTVPWDLLTGAQQEGFTLTVVPPERMNMFLFACVPLAGFAAGLVFSALAYRRPPAGVFLRRFLAPTAGLALVCLLPLLLFGLRLSADLRSLHGQGVPLAEQAGLVAASEKPRTVVFLAGPTLGNRTAAFNMPGSMNEANQERLQAFVREHPRSLAAPQAHRTLIAAARLQWDEPAMWRAIFDYGVSGHASPWFTSVIALRLAVTPPHARYLAVLQRIHSDEFVTVSPRYTFRALGRAFLRHGDARTAEKLMAQDPVPGAQDNVTERPRLATGEIRGRLLAGNAPVVGVGVRLVGVRELRSESVTADDTLMWRALGNVQEDEKLSRDSSERIDTLTRCFTATRTDAQGRFRFQGMPDDRYMLLLLVDGTVEEVARRTAGIRQGVVVVSPEHPTVDVGDIKLGEGP